MEGGDVTVWWGHPLSPSLSLSLSLSLPLSFSLSPSPFLCLSLPLSLPLSLSCDRLVFDVGVDGDKLPKAARTPHCPHQHHEPAVIPKSVSLKYEPASEPLHIYVK